MKCPWPLVKDPSALVTILTGVQEHFLFFRKPGNQPWLSREDCLRLALVTQKATAFFKYDLF